MSSSSLFKLYILTGEQAYFDQAVAAKEEEKNVARIRKPAFDVTQISNVEFLFRFNHDELRRLANSLRLPEKIIYNAQVRMCFSGMEALCVVLRRLAYPNRLGDITYIFNREESQLSRIFNWTLEYINNNFGHLLTSCDVFWLNPDHLQVYAEKVMERGSPLDNCIGFIDGTIRPNCRPLVDQESIYNGHKRVHALKYQSIMLPNGLIGNLYGPIPGKRHDGHLLKKSGVIEKLRPKFARGGGLPPYCIFGDPAYTMAHAELLAPFPTSRITPEQELFNKRMSSVRQSVEWGFGRICNNFAFVDFKKNLKLNLQPIGLYFRIAVIFSNCLNCFRGSITSSYFEIEPPTVEQYLSNIQ